MTERQTKQIPPCTFPLAPKRHFVCLVSLLEPLRVFDSLRRSALQQRTHNRSRVRGTMREIDLPVRYQRQYSRHITLRGMWLLARYERIRLDSQLR